MAVYVVLFLNFGPSFHRADFFGLHAEAINSVTCCSCCCDVSYDGPAFGADHDCAVCRCFDLLQIATPNVPFFAAESFAAFREFRPTLHYEAVSFSPQARGPPTDSPIS